MDKKMFLVSVVITVYNMEKYLGQCVDSVRNQTYPHLEVLLVDDGSTDQSLSLCESYAKEDERIRVLSKKNGGLVSAWTYGAKEAAGDYLCFVDSDDWIEKGMIEALVKEALGENKEIICSNYVIEKEERKERIPVTQSMVPGIYDRKQIKEEIRYELLGHENRRIHCSRCMKLISKELILQNLKFTDDRITMGEDLNIMFPCFLDAERIVILEGRHDYHYRFVDSSMVHKYNPLLSAKILLLYQALEKVIAEKIEEKEVREQLRERLKKEYLFLMLLAIKNELRGPAEGLVPRIKKMIQERKEEGLRSTKITAESKANRLLYQVWKTPNSVTIGTAKAAVWLFDRR